jgi:hypothetical protein
MIHNHLSVKTEPTECYETSAFNIQTPGKYPEENLPRFGLLEPKHDGTGHFATPGNTRPTKQTQILKKNLNIGFK